MTDYFIVVYDKLETDFTHYGLGVIRNTLEPGPRIFERLNAEYTCDFSVPYMDPAAQHLEEDNIVKIAGQLFIIRTVEESRDSNGRLLADVFAEHITTELLTEYIPLLTYSSATASAIVSGILAGTRFTGNAMAVTSSHNFTVERRSATWGLNHFLVLADAEMKRDNFDITFKPEIGVDNGVRISYRKNLKSIKRTKEGRGVITRLFVFGKDGITLAAPIDSANIGLYPRPKSGEITFDEITDLTALAAAGTAYLATVDTPRLSYEADIIELKNAEGYDISEEIQIGDTVYIDEEDLGINVTARIVEYEELPFAPDRSRVTLANFLPGLTDTLSGIGETVRVVDQVTTGNGQVSTSWIEGQINVLRNQLVASGSYASAGVIDGQGFLLENLDEASPDYGALYLGPGIFAIASEQIAGEWQWQTFGTGNGFTADHITTGTLQASLITIGSGTQYDAGYDPSTKETPAGAQTKANTAEAAAKAASVLKGTKYKSVYIDDNGFHIDNATGEVVRMGEWEAGKFGVVGYHADGSKTVLDGTGLTRMVGGSTKPYNYLSAAGSSETGSAGAYFDRGAGTYENGTPNGGVIANKVITLPADFQGKNFTVALSVKSSAPYTMAQRDGDPYTVPFVDLGNYLEVVNVNTAAGTFEVKGYGQHMVMRSSDSTLWNKYWAIQFSYMVVA